MKCKDEKSNLCRRVLRQMLEQNKQMTECLMFQDGEWEDWEDTEPCQALEKCILQTGFKGQRRRCKRSLGGKYCQAVWSISMSRTFPRSCYGVSYDIKNQIVAFKAP